MNSNACPTPPQPHSTLTRPTRHYSALLGPTRPYSAPLGPNWPHAAPLHAQPLPNPTQPYPALLGPTRPYSAPLGPNRPPRGGLAWGHLRVQLLPVQSDTAGLSASVFLPVLGSAALAAAIKYIYIYIYIYIYYAIYNYTKEPRNPIPIIKAPSVNPRRPRCMLVSMSSRNVVRSCF